MTLSYDFHIHSSSSIDSILNPEMILKIAMREGLNGLAVTDHGTVKGGLKTARMASKLKGCDLSVIPGIEVRTEKGHILGLFLQDEIRTTEFSAVIDCIEAQGGFSILAHPMKFPELVSLDTLKAVDAVEVFNARISEDKNEAMKRIADENGLFQTAGSDAHTPLEVGRARVMFEDQSGPTSAKELRHLLATSRLKGSVSPRFVHYVSFGVEKVRRLV